MKRRNFLKNSSFAALGSAPIANTLLNLKLMSNAVAQGSSGDGDYKALVCVFLRGGNDAYNMLVPTTGGLAAGSEYMNYSNVRSNLALPLPGSGGQDALLPLDIKEAEGRSFGLHGAMPKLQGRVDDGNATFIANLGSLVEKPDLDAIRSGTARLPFALLSHSDQQIIWQTSVANTDSKTGWGGRLADKILARYPNSSHVSMNISLNGNQTFLLGDQVMSYAIGPNGASSLTGAGVANNQLIEDVARLQGAHDIVGQSHEHLLLNTFAREKKTSFDAVDAFSNAFNGQAIATPFGESALDLDLKAVAKTIATANELGQQRQIFFVNLDDFDSHFALLPEQRDRLTMLDNALDSFWRFMDDHDLRDKVTTFTCSEFGRTLRPNGQGTDHAWAGHSVVMGGAVKQRLVADGIENGSKIYGHYPTADELKTGYNEGLDVGATGRIMPTTSIDEYFAELALWFGLSESDLEDVLPNIKEFYDPLSSENPIGFLPSKTG